MADRSEPSTLELRIAFHNAVSRLQAWTDDVAEPRVKLHGRFCSISEVCEEVGNLSYPHIIARMALRSQCFLPPISSFRLSMSRSRCRPAPP